MLMCTQLKLSERRSAQRINFCTQGTSSIVSRPCTQQHITGASSRIFSALPTPEKRSTELRVVSLNLESNIHCDTTKTAKRPPQRMPTFCEHLKRIQKINQRDLKEIDDEFLVRGVEVGSGSNGLNHLQETVYDGNQGYDDGLDELHFGMQIELTDCCQCVCDLFTNNFRTLHDDNDFGFVAMESCNSSRSLRPKDVPPSTEKSSILDPNILKVIRVTMNTKNKNHR